MPPVRSTEMTMFSGLLSRTSLTSFGSWTGIDIVTTGIVIRKMISSTSITSTRGVVLMVETTSSSPSGEPTFIATALSPDDDGFWRRAQQYGVQIRAETAHALHRGLVAAHEPVVAEHGRNRDRETERRHDQRFTHRPC